MTANLPANRPSVHWVNPWPEAIPVPLEELAPCVAGGLVGTVSGEVKPYDVEYVLAEWRRYGEKLDGYLLIAGSGDPMTISVGVRYGEEGAQYLAPGCRNRSLAMDLIRKYRSDPVSECRERGVEIELRGGFYRAVANGPLGRTTVLGIAEETAEGAARKFLQRHPDPSEPEAIVEQPALR